MDIKILISSFSLIFLAELGDKTQLATLAFAASSPSRFSVFLGAGAALLASTALAVLCGEAVCRFLPPRWLNLAAGAGFVLMGSWMLAKGLRS